MTPDTPRSGIRREIFSYSDEERKARHEAIRVDIARRLRNACIHLGDEEFATLIDRIVNVQLKGERGPWKKPS